LLEVAKRLDEEQAPIPIQAQVDSEIVSLGWVHYGLSPAARNLRLFPFYQLLILVLFLLIGVWAITVYRRSQEEHIWAALARETAHQLGTPLSSMAGWLEVLKIKRKDRVIPQLVEDLKRLEVVAERFSRIGMKPVLRPQRAGPVIEETFDYIKRRAPAQVKMELLIKDDPVIPIDEVLISWTVENLLKNALDAIGERPGWIRIESRLSPDGQRLRVSVSDSGPGIRGRPEKIFQPGFTSKRHGWGVGLTLVRRIIEEYHSGRLEVLSSTPRGTTLAIQLNLK
jgi:hypothetical protein